MRIHCQTYRQLGFLLEMHKRGFKISLEGPVSGRCDLNTALGADRDESESGNA